MRRACPACRASAPWPGRSWSWCTCRGAAGTWEQISPGWMYRLGIAIDRKDQPVCDEKAGHVGRAECRRVMQAHDRKIREEAIRSVTGRPARPALTPTDYAQRVLIVVGGIVLLASMNFLLHALLCTLAALFVLVCSVAVVVTMRRRRRRRTVVRAPLPAPARTMVTGVRVRAIGAPARSGKAIRNEGARVPQTR